jgi:hypothetical protein
VLNVIEMMNTETAQDRFCSSQSPVFIDEGYYDFRWMKNMGNWMVFLVISLFYWVGNYWLNGSFFENQ